MKHHIFLSEQIKIYEIQNGAHFALIGIQTGTF